MFYFVRVVWVIFSCTGHCVAAWSLVSVNELMNTCVIDSSRMLRNDTAALKGRGHLDQDLFELPMPKRLSSKSC